MKEKNPVGSTPLVKIKDQIFAKAEYLNPTGSIKDRIAVWIFDRAEEDGILHKGKKVVEASSGNTAISFSYLCSERGYDMTVIMPSNMSQERKDLVKSYGATLIETGPGDFEGAIRLRNRMVEEGYWSPMQFENPQNIECHAKTTAIEIWYQMEMNVDVLVAGTGTGGTIMGVGGELKKLNSSLRVVAVEPKECPVMYNSFYGTSLPVSKVHGIQGIGDGSKYLVELDMVDEIILISTEEAIQKVKELAEVGISAGISAAANILAAERVDKPDQRTVTFLCDDSSKYQSLIDVKRSQVISV
jgi:cysteine synthase A